MNDLNKTIGYWWSSIVGYSNLEIRTMGGYEQATVLSRIIERLVKTPGVNNTA
jgi:hypothetical protein